MQRSELPMLHSLNSLATGTGAIYRRSLLLPELSYWRRRGGAVQQQAVVKAERGRKGEMMPFEETHEAVTKEVAQTHISHCLPDEELGLVEASPWPKPLSPLAGKLVNAIELERAMKAEAAMASQPAFTPSDIIYEDKWLIVINKPSGIYSGHVLSTVTCMLASREEDTAAALDSTGEDTAAALDSTGATTSQPHLHLANRLDRDTSGVMIVTKCKIVAGKLTRMFQNRKAKKTYIALCIGPRPTWDEVYVETGHGRSRWGAWRVYPYEDVGRKLPEKAVVKDMSTRFSVLSVNGERVSNSCCNRESCETRRSMRDQPYENVPAFGDEVLVRAEPLSGRTHQIRLHCQFLGLPLRGDIKYGGPLVWKGTNYGTHALHAESMSFRHPITDANLSFVAPLPMWAAG